MLDRWKWIFLKDIFKNDFSQIFEFQNINLPIYLLLFQWYLQDNKRNDQIITAKHKHLNKFQAQARTHTLLTLSEKRKIIWDMEKNGKNKSCLWYTFTSLSRFVHVIRKPEIILVWESKCYRR